jgi:hypothetical protein
MSNKLKQLEKNQQELKIRQQALHLTVIYEHEFVEKFGKRGLNDMRDKLLDRINELKNDISQLKKDLNL